MPDRSGPTAPSHMSAVELGRSLWRARRDPFGPLVDLVQAHGDAVQGRIPGLHMVALHRAEHLERVLVSNQDAYVKGVDYDLFSAALGRGLVTSRGDLWRRQRRLIQPMFAKRHLEPFASHMTAAGERLLEHWETTYPDGARVDVRATMTELTLDVVGHALFGTSLAGERSRTIGVVMNEILDELSRTGRSPLTWAAQTLPGVTMDRALRLRPRRHRRFRRALREVDAIVEEMIDAGRGRPSRNGDDLLALLLEARDEETGEPMPARQVRDEVVTFVMAGHETTATALSWTWWLLGRHPKARDRLHSEVDEVFSGRTPGFADVDRLVWTKAAVQEALRLYPPIWIMLREAARDDVVGSVRIPRGAIVFAIVYLAHRDPDVWPDPEAFDPARFLPEAAAERPRHSFLAFSAGRRGCVGSTFALTEATLLTAMIAQRYVLDPDGDADAVPEATLTLRPRSPLPMRLRHR